jgi:four helix bundle protein
MVNTSVQTTVKVPENSVNQLLQEIENLKQRLAEIESFKIREINNWFSFFLFFILFVLVVLSLYFNYRINFKFKKMNQNQKTNQNQAKKPDNEINSEKSEDLIDEFIRGVIELASRIPQSPVNEPIINQLVKVVSSIGSGLVWAKKPESRRDFQYRMNICRKKVQETEYWLKMVILISPELKKEAEILIQEAGEVKKFLDLLSDMYKNY